MFLYCIIYSLIQIAEFILDLTLTRPLRRKLRMRWFFDVSKVKELRFFKSNLTVSPSVLYEDHFLSQMV